MSPSRSLGAILLPLLLVSCALQPRDGDTGSVGSSAAPNGVLGDREVRDYELPLPPLAESADLFRGLPKADFVSPDRTLTDDAASFSLQDWDTPVKSQGSRPWCTAFAQVAVIENMVRHGFGEIVNLSEIDHWDHYQEYAIVPSIEASRTTMIVPETSWPYYGSPISGYRSTAIAKITSWRSLTKRSQVWDALRAQHPVHLGVDLNNSWNAPGKGGRISVGSGFIGGHAMAIVGYQDDPTYEGAGYFLIKNSWGSKWGDLGYARMPYDYCKYHSCYFLETLGVVYGGKTWDGTTPPPPPPPSDDPTAADLVVVTRKNPKEASKFTLALVERRAGALAKVKSVTYDVHETFKEFRLATVTDPKDGFVIPYEYTTYFKGRWKTNGAAIQLASGATLNVPGANVDWFFVDKG